MVKPTKIVHGIMQPQMMQHPKLKEWLLFGMA